MWRICDLNLARATGLTRQDIGARRVRPEGGASLMLRGSQGRHQAAQDMLGRVHWHERRLLPVLVASPPLQFYPAPGSLNYDYSNRFEGVSPWIIFSVNLDNYVISFQNEFTAFIGAVDCQGL